MTHLIELLVATSVAHKEGRAYCLDSQALEKLTRKVLAQSHPPAPEYEGDEFEIKMLREYISSDGSLKSIPSQQKKRAVILKPLAMDFERRVKYPEAQLNKILGR